MRVLVECYPDAAVLRALGVTKKQLRHERCKGEVIKRVRKLDCAIGIIDEDPGSTQPRDLANYDEQVTVEGLCRLVRRNDPDRKLIVICPRLENWLIARAISSGIKPEDYGLPSDPHRLHAIPHYEDTQGFKRFLTDLIDRDTAGIGLLRQWLQESLRA